MSGGFFGDSAPLSGNADVVASGFAISNTGSVGINSM
jgi:hypothetical protein